ncbi:MAG: phosphoribosylanthranilate isomerase [Eubacterium sp.]
MAKIKICGLRREEDISYVNILKPDYVGFILSNGFRRSIEMETVTHLRNRLAAGINAVGVFVNESVEIVNACIKMQVIDMVQLHGNESADYCKKINAPIIKVLKPDDFDKIKDYEPYIDYFMFDSGTGTGTTFDWSKIPKTDKPFFLAGGLDKNNLKHAIETINPYAVDMSSSVETEGIKDYDKIKKVIDIVRSTK